MGRDDEGRRGMEVMMGDLVLLQDEVNPVMSALLDNGLDVTALHNHFFWDEPRMYYMHVHGHGTAAELAQQTEARTRSDRQADAAAPAAAAPAAAPPPTLDTAKLARSSARRANRPAPSTRSRSAATI